MLWSSWSIDGSTLLQMSNVHEAGFKTITPSRSAIIPGSLMPTADSIAARMSFVCHIENTSCRFRCRLLKASIMELWTDIRELKASASVVLWSLLDEYGVLRFADFWNRSIGFWKSRTWIMVKRFAVLHAIILELMASGPLLKKELG